MTGIIITVDTLDDVVDGGIGELGADGRRSLREALRDAAQTPGDDPCIEFSEDLAGGVIRLQSSITLQPVAGQSTFFAHIMGDIDDDGQSDITISGDRTGDGRSADDVRLFNVAGGANLTLDDLTLAGGYQRTADATYAIGVPYSYAENAVSTILTQGVVTLNRVSIVGAYARGGDGVGSELFETLVDKGADAASIIVLSGGTLNADDLLMAGNVATGGDAGYERDLAGDGGDAASIIVRSGGSANVFRAGFGDAAAGGDGGPGVDFHGGDGGEAIRTILSYGAVNAQRIGEVDGASSTAGAGGAPVNPGDASGDPGQSRSFLNNGTGTTTPSQASAFGNGDDTAQGGGGEDNGTFFLGFGGDDDFTIRAERDTVYGGSGNDTITFGGATRAINGGLAYGEGGDDRIVITRVEGASFIVEGGKGTDTFDSSALTADQTIDLTDNGAQEIVDFLNLPGDPDFTVTVRGIENLVASTGNDILIGDGAANRLEGGGGRDALTGGGGNDTLIAGDGGATGAPQSLTGGPGEDLIVIAGSGVAVVQGGAGGEGGDQDTAGVVQDTLSFQGQATGVQVSLDAGALQQASLGLQITIAAVENLIGSDLSDTLSGSSDVKALDNRIEGRGGGDQLFGLAGDDTLEGGAGADTLTGGADDDSLDGGTEADNLFGEAGDDTLKGGAGADTLEGGSGTNAIDGGADDDQVTFRKAQADYTITRAGQAVSVTDGDETSVIENVETFAFADATRSLVDLFPELAAPPPGAGGATPQDDDLTGTSGADRINALAGDDRVRGLGGRDTLLGAQGDDTLLGGGGKDLLKGQGGKDVLKGQGGADKLAGGGGRDKLVGGGGKDKLAGGGGNDKLNGGGGNDRLVGGGGKDTLKGGAGADTLIGGAKDDLLIGGGGADTIIFAGRSGSDVIRGFQQGVDVIDVKGAANFAALTIEQEAGGARISFAGGDVLAAGQSAGAFSEADFKFRAAALKDDGVLIASPMTPGDEFL